jgi:hypothetical protein
MNCLLFGNTLVRRSPNLSEEQARQRFAEVGGIVRHVFSESYAKVLSDQEDRVKELKLEELMDMSSRMRVLVEMD